MDSESPAQAADIRRKTFFIGTEEYLEGMLPANIELITAFFFISMIILAAMSYSRSCAVYSRSNDCPGHDCSLLVKIGFHLDDQL